MSDLQKLITRWCSPLRWRSLRNRHAAWRNYQAGARQWRTDAWKLKAAGQDTSGAMRLAEQEESLASTERRVLDALESELAEIGRLLITRLPKLLGKLPVVDLHTLPPDDEKTVTLAERMQDLLGHVLGEQSELEPLAKGEAKNKGKLSVNDRMFAESAKRGSEVSEWTAEKWSEHLGCAKSTVAETKAWKALRTMRQVKRLQLTESGNSPPPNKRKPNKRR